MKKENILEAFLLIVVLASLVVVPFVIRKINDYYRLSKFPEGSQLITLYGITEGGIWTDEPVTSFNYWWKTFPQAVPEVKQGYPVVVKVTSVDVYHGIGLKMPGLRINEKVKPGQWTTLQFTGDKPGSFRFICTIRCGKDHARMRSEIAVVE